MKKLKNKNTAETVPVETRWQTARELLATCRAGADAIIQLGSLLFELKQDIYRECGGSGHWPYTVEKELGISHKTAERLVERSQYVARIRTLSQGEGILYLDSKNKEQKIEDEAVTPDMQEMAANMLELVLSGEVSAQRAFAGLLGETCRAEDALAGKKTTNHFAVLKRSLTSLSISLKHWKKITNEQRFELENIWDGMKEVIPQTWHPEEV